LINTQDGEEMMDICFQEGASKIVDGLDKRGWDILGERVATGDRYWVVASACLMDGLRYPPCTYEKCDPDEENLNYAWGVLRGAWHEVLLKDPFEIIRLERGGSNWILTLDLTCSTLLAFMKGFWMEAIRLNG